MKPTRTILVALAMCASPLLAGAVEPAAKVVTFQASVRVDVDASGKPVKVAAPGDLPEGIRAYIENRVASWQYEPARQNGVAVAATTYVGVNACAVPLGDSYRLGLDFNGNGVRRAGDQALAPPLYPSEAMRRGTQAEFVLVLDVAPDGAARISEVEKSEFDARAGRTGFQPVLERWVKTIHFDPELVAGKPVRGQVRVPVSFVLRAGPQHLQALREEFQAEAKASRECQMAAGADEMRPVAMDPVVKVTPVPAS